VHVNVLELEAVTLGGVPPEPMLYVAVELHPPGLTTNVYTPTPDTAVADDVGEVTVEPPGPVHEYVGAPADVVAVNVVFVTPHANVGEVIDAVGGAVPVIGEIKIY
jgi:hypothetical protein